MKKNWLFYALVTTVTWGVWGAFSEIPEQGGFPSTLTYVVWAISMVPCALVALKKIDWKPDLRPMSALLGMGVGILGAAGQLILFQALREGPAYIIFPVVSVSPILTVLLSAIFLRERVGWLSWIGVGLALVSIACLSVTGPDGSTGSGFLWIVLALLVFLLWGIQAFVMKVANNYTPDAESVFVYMAISSLVFIPVALLMTDFSAGVNMGWSGLSFVIQILNAIGALTLVYAMRYGKAMVVSPLANALAPMLTVIISLVIHQRIPPVVQLVGITIALASVFILSKEE